MGASSRGMKNEYKIIDDYAIIYCVSKIGKTFEVLVDLDDLQKLIEYGHTIYCRRMYISGKVYPSVNEYFGVNINGHSIAKSYLLHRFILGHPDYIIDHKNHNTLDDRKENLIPSNKTLNAMNRVGANANSSTGYRNVSIIKNKYIVQLQIDGKNVVLGSFDDVEEANAFAEEMRKKYYNQFED
jgi:hypothetical protein